MGCGHRRGEVARILCAHGTIGLGLSCIGDHPAALLSLRNLFWTAQITQIPSRESKEVWTRILE